jgi:regulator of replication initiation timing
MPQAEPVQGDDLEHAVDAAIAACDGDLRATIRALVISNSFLNAENERLRECTSAGYIRGKLNLIEWLTRLP